MQETAARHIQRHSPIFLCERKKEFTSRLMICLQSHLPIDSSMSVCCAVCVWVRQHTILELPRKLLRVFVISFISRPKLFYVDSQPQAMNTDTYAIYLCSYIVLKLSISTVFKYSIFTKIISGNIKMSYLNFQILWSVVNEMEVNLNLIAWIYSWVGNLSLFLFNSWSDGICTLVILHWHFGIILFDRRCTFHILNQTILDITFIRPIRIGFVVDRRGSANRHKTVSSTLFFFASLETQSAKKANPENKNCNGDGLDGKMDG